MFAKSWSRRKQHVSEGSGVTEGCTGMKWEPGGPILLNKCVIKTSISSGNKSLAARPNKYKEASMPLEKNQY